MKISKEQIMKAVNDTKVICWSDLLCKLDLLPLFEKYTKEHNKKYDIKKIFIGKTLLNNIDSILKSRILKSKDKRIRSLKESYRLSTYNMDCLQSMPEEAKEDIDCMLLEDL